MGEPEIVEVRPPTPDEEALVSLFAELEKTSLDRLDAGAQQVITLVTGLLGLFLGVLALGDAPPYLAHPDVRALGLMATGGFFVALLFALSALRPRPYTFSRHSLTQMRARLAEMREVKSRALRRAHWAFGFGILALVLLLVDLIVWRM